MADLISVISRVTRRPRGAVRPEASLHALGLGTSLAVSVLRSAIENRLKVRIPSIGIDSTVGEIQAMVDGRGSDDLQEHGAVPRSVAATTRPTRADPLAGIGVGIDIELVEALPEADDYEEHEFYKAHFTPREISEAVSRPDRKQHFCGLFCAKEALKKSNDRFLDLRMSDIEVTYEPSGRPTIRTTRADLNARFRFRVTISHTSKLATAVVVSATGVLD